MSVIQGLFNRARSKGQARLQTFKRSDSGQAVLIVILIMVVVLTVGLSVASRMIINMKTSSDQANSQKALAAAEAGIERSIKAINNGSIGSGETVVLSSGGFNTTYTTAVNSIRPSDPVSLKKDGSMYLWLTTYKATLFTDPWSGNLTIYWGDPGVGDCSNAALEIALISGSKATPKLDRYMYDPCNSRRGSNHFASVGGGNATYKYGVTINGVSNGLIAKITALYFGTTVSVVGSGNLPDQGKIIDSTGVVNNNVTRKVSLEQRYNWLPDGLFPYILFSP